MTDSSSDRNPVEQLAEEFLERHRRGERPSLTEYTDRYPDLADEIRELFPALVMMEQLKPDSADATGSYGGAPEGKRLERLGDFRILREVGRGGMGIVYEAEQESLGRHVALKVLPSQSLLDPQHQKRFQREARAAARLHHTNIVPVFGVGEHEGLHYYVMQFIQGLGLDDVLRELRRLRQAKSSPAVNRAGTPQPTVRARDVSAAEVVQAFMTGHFAVTETAGRNAVASDGPAERHPLAEATTRTSVTPQPHLATGVTADASGVHLPGQAGQTALSESGRHYWQSVARVGIQVADALEYANGQGIVHRDIKPSNLLLDTQGTVWVTDFGLAKATADGDNLTHTGDIVGTLRYMAPERFQGHSDVRADIYSLGLTLYELLVQRPAYQETDRNKLIQQVTHEEPPRPRKLNPRIPRDLETIVLKAIDREPARRYQTPAALAGDLKRFVEDKPILARRLHLGERVWRWCRRNPALATATGLAIVALVGVTVLSVAFNIAQSRSAADLSDAFQSVSQEKDRTQAALTRSKELARNLAAEKKRTEDALGRSRKLARTLDAEKKRTEAALSRSEELAGNLKGANKNLADEQKRTQDALADARRLYANLAVMDQQNPRRGMLWLARSLQLTPADDDKLQRVIRTNLAGLGSEVPVLRAGLAHAGVVHAAAFSPDGKMVLTGDDRAAHLWDAATGKPIGQPLAHQAVVWAVAFSPNGKTALTGCSDRTALRWDVATGQPVGQPLLHPGVVLAVAFSPDGKTFATGCQDRKARLWRTDTGKLIGSPLDSDNAVGQVLFSPDGKTFLTAGNSPTVHLWDVATGKPRSQALQHPNTVYRAVFSPDSKLVFTACFDKKGRLWDVATGKLVGSPMEHPDVIGPVAFRPDGKAVLTGSNRGTAQLWEVATGKPLGQTMHHSVLIATVAFSPDGRTVLTSSNDKTARLWDADTGQPVGQPLPHPAPVGSAVFSPDGRTVLTIATDKVVRLWDQPTGRMTQAPLVHLDGVYVVAFSPDGKAMVTSGGDREGGKRGEAQLWDRATGRPIGPALLHRALVDTVAFSPDGKLLATGSVDTTARLWDAASGKPVGPPLQHGSSVWVVAFSPDGKTLVTASFDRTARLWDVASGRPVGQPMQHLGGVTDVAFSPDGQTVLTGSQDQTARLWHADTGAPLGLTMRHAGIVRRVAFSPDGQTVLTASFDKTARLWDAHTGRPIGLSLDHHGPVSWVAFSPDGKTILTAGDKTVRLWDRASGQPVGQPLQHQEDLHAVVFSPDGAAVLTGSEDKTARLWSAQTGLPLSPPLVHQGTVWAVAFSPQGGLLLTGSNDKTARLWEAPAPIAGTPERLSRWVEVGSGMELSPDGSVSLLDAAAWQDRRRRLDKLGGPPDVADPSGHGFGWHQRLAAECAETGHWFAARWHLDRLIEAQPRDWYAHALRGRAYVKLGQLDLAAADCGQALKLGPAETVRDGFSRQSPGYETDSTWETALWYLDHLVAAQPQAGPAYVLRTRAYVELGRLDKAAADYGKALELGPRDDVLARCRSFWEECETKEQWRTGLWYLNRLAKAQPRDSYVHGRLGKAHGRLGQFEEAARAYARAVELRPNDPLVWQPDAVMKLDLGDVAGYRKACASLLRYVGPTSVATTNNTAAWACALAPGAVADTARPVQLAERAVAQSPQTPLYGVTLGAALYRAGRYNDAVLRLNATARTQLSGGTVTTWLFLAMAQQRLGHAAPAATWLDKAGQWLDQSTPEKPKDARMGIPVLWATWLEMQMLRAEAAALIRGSPATKDPKVLLAFARANVRLKQWDKAAADYGQAIKAGPKDWQPLVERGQCFVELRHWDKAAADYTAAIELQADNPQLRVDRARCYGQLKQPGKADADYARAIALKTKAIESQRETLTRAPTVIEYREAITGSYRELTEWQRAAGRPTEAAATLLQLRQLWPGHPAHLNEVARELALCVPLIGKDKASLTEKEQAQRRRLADEAMETLGQALVAGFPVTAALQPDPAFAALRSRDDFKALVAAVALKSKFAAPTGQIHQFPGHWHAGVESVALSPDGRRAVSCGLDKVVRLWDLDTAKEVRHFDGHTAAVFGIAFLPDGRRAVSSSSDGTIRLWNLTTGKQLRLINSESGWDQHVACSPDGRRMLFGSNDGSLHLWDIEKNQEVRRFNGQTKHLTCMAFSPDGRRALSGGQDQTVRLWDVDTGKEIAHFEAIAPPDPNTGEEMGRLEDYAASVWSVAFSSDGRQALSAHQDGFVRLWDIASGREVRRFEGHWDAVRCAAFSPDGKQIVSGGHNGKVIVWDTATGREQYRFASAPGTMGLAITPDSRHLLTASSDTYLYLWLLSEEAARARDHARLGRTDEAAADYARALLHHPDEPSLRIERARFYARHGRFDQAAADYAKALGSKPRDADLWVERGRCYAELGRWDEAAAAFARAMVLLPPDESPFGRRSQVGGELALWDKVFDRVVELRPHDAHLWVARGRMNGRLRRWDRAAADYARVIDKRHVEGNEEMFENACLRLIVGDSRGYRRFCQQTVARAGDTKNTFAAFILARMCCLVPNATPDPSRAVRWAEQALAAEKHNYLFHALGAAHYRAGQFELAVQRLEESDRSGWGDASVVNWLFLAMAQHQLGHADEARKWLDKATALLQRVVPASPDEPVTLLATDWFEAQVLRPEAEKLLNAPHRREAEEAMRKEQWPQAIGHLDHLVRSDPAFWPDQVARAHCLARLGRWHQAAAEYAAAFDTHLPSDANTWFEYAHARLEAGDKEGYRQVCARMLEHSATTADPSTHFLMAWTCGLAAGALDDPAQLVQVAARAVGTTKASWALHAQGLAHYRAGQFDLAIQRLQESRRLDPSWGSDVLNRLVLAMAQNRAGRTELAGAWWTNTVTWLDVAAKGKPLESKHPLLSWRDWLLFRTLFDEAVRLFDRPPYTTDPRWALTRGRTHALLGRWDRAAADLEQAVRQRPKSVAAYETLGRAYVHLASWDKAVATFTELVKLQPGGPWNCYCLAAAQLGKGDVAGYRRTCADMRKRFGQTEVSAVAVRVVYACVAAPGAAGDGVELIRLAEIAAHESRANLRAQAAALYRTDKSQAAIACFRSAAAAEPFRAWDWLFLALAHHDLGHAGDARQCLDKAVQWIEQADRPDAPTTWADWYERVEVQHLRLEAESLLKAKAARKK
jgi:WD40 repeat protein/serine/threonine protein kinase/regulator of sirC expression with transglutaminase-like and TPR domain